jgi:hypothetical protein
LLDVITKDPAPGAGVIAQESVPATAAELPVISTTEEAEILGTETAGDTPATSVVWRKQRFPDAVVVPRTRIMSGALESAGFVRSDTKLVEADIL